MGYGANAFTLMRLDIWNKASNSSWGTAYYTALDVDSQGATEMQVGVADEQQDNENEMVVEVAVTHVNMLT